MRTMLLISFLTAVIVRGEEPSSPTVRQKLHAKIMESISPPQPAEQSADKKVSEDVVAPVVVMKPFVVSESNRGRELDMAIAREDQKKEEGKFSVVNGGTIYKNSRLELGGWWTPSEGWSFLKIKW